MSSVNKIILVGRLGQDPETRQFDNGNKIATVSLATSEKWTDKQTGEQKEQTEWHRVTFSNRLAEIAGQYLRKGSLVYLEGSLRTRKWTDNNGVERYSTEIRANQMQMLSGKQDSQQNNGYPQNGGYQPQQAPQNTAQGNFAPPPQVGQRYATYPDGQPVFPPQPINTQGQGLPNDDVPF